MAECMRIQFHVSPFGNFPLYLNPTQTIGTAYTRVEQAVHDIFHTSIRVQRLQDHSGVALPPAYSFSALMADGANVQVEYKRGAADMRKDVPDQSLEEEEEVPIRKPRSPRSYSPRSPPTSLEQRPPLPILQAPIYHPLSNQTYPTQPPAIMHAYAHHGHAPYSDVFYPHVVSGSTDSPRIIYHHSDSTMSHGSQPRPQIHTPSIAPASPSTPASPQSVSHTPRASSPQSSYTSSPASSPLSTPSLPFTSYTNAELIVAQQPPARVLQFKEFCFTINVKGGQPQDESVPEWTALDLLELFSLTVFEENGTPCPPSKFSFRGLLLDREQQVIAMFVRVKVNSFYGRKRYVVKVKGVGPFQGAKCAVTSPIVVASKKKKQRKRQRVEESEDAPAIEAATIPA